MKSFDLVQPRSLEEALGALPTEREGGGSALVLAGGQDLLGELKDHLVRPERLVDLSRLAGLAGIEHGSDGSLTIGALAKVAALEHDGRVRERWPMLAEAAESVATPQIRNLGTVGGNLCQRPRCWYYRHEEAVCLKKGGSECFAYSGRNEQNAILGGGPSYIVHPSDLAPALVAYDAEVALVSPRGARGMLLESFFILPSEGEVTRENVLAPDELVREVRVPAGKSREDGWRATYVKIRGRDSFDFALSAVALAAVLERDRIREARLVLGGVAPKPWRSQAAEELLVGRAPGDEAALAAAAEALRLAQPLEENGYKVPMTKGAIVKAVRRVAQASR